MPDGITPPQVTPPQVTPLETIHVNVRNPPCDGGGGALGHPRVFLRIEGSETVCPYCSRRYVLNEGAGGDHGH